VPGQRVQCLALGSEPGRGRSSKRKDPELVDRDPDCPIRAAPPSAAIRAFRLRRGEAFPTRLAAEGDDAPDDAVRGYGGVLLGGTRRYLVGVFGDT
jgi:hypothetical protein